MKRQGESLFHPFPNLTSWNNFYLYTMSEDTLILKRTLTPAFTDARGDIFDVVEKPISHVGLIVSTVGAVRGNHYHKASTQYTYVVKGQFKFITSDIDGNNRVETILEEGDYSEIPPGVVHTYVALTPGATFLDMTTLARGEKGYEEDTVRVNDRS